MNNFFYRDWKDPGLKWILLASSAKSPCHPWSWKLTSHLLEFSVSACIRLQRFGQAESSYILMSDCNLWGPSKGAGGWDIAEDNLRIKGPLGCRISCQKLRMQYGVLEFFYSPVSFPNPFAFAALSSSYSPGALHLPAQRHKRPWK